MSDIHSKETRSYNMSRIRSKDTKPEMLIRKFLFSHGFRYRLHDKTLPGKPDIVLKRYQTVIFIHGCFWHMHKNCQFFKMPSSNKDYWEPKLLANAEKDKAAIKCLKKLNYRVVIIWECKLKSTEKDKVLEKLLKILSE